MIRTYNNPIIKGFNPDPSMCIVGKDAYIINSSFEYFPGVPVYHSTNMTDWTRINYCLKTEEHLKLTNCRCSGGIFAPSIRYHNGRFYMITTNISHKGNFIVYTDDIYGEWSLPIWIDHSGIDPSLFFDDDGKVYFTGTGQGDDGDRGIVLFEINPDNGQVLSEKKVVSHGSGGRFPEGPHIYKKDGWYYLMIAEGGTEYGHMETIFRSKNVWGPYEGCPHNPILTNKNVSRGNIECCGHADIAEDENGNWWMCCLGVRRLNNKSYLHNLGRETFLLQVKWENGWPVVSNNGVVEEVMEADLPVTNEKPHSYDFHDEFDSERFGLEWNFMRNPDLNNYVRKDGTLTLWGNDNTLSTLNPIFVGVRQTEFEETVKAELDTSSIEEGGQAGIAVYYSTESYMTLCVKRTNGELKAILQKIVMNMECKEESVVIDKDQNVVLELETSRDTHKFYVTDNLGRRLVGEGYAAALCTEATISAGFTGDYIGLTAYKTKAVFNNFDVKLKD